MILLEKVYDFHIMLMEKVWLSHDADGEGLTCYTWCWWRMFDLHMMLMDRFDVHMMLMEKVWLTHDADGEGMTFTWCWWRRFDLLNMMLMEKAWFSHNAAENVWFNTWCSWRMMLMKKVCWSKDADREAYTGCCWRMSYLHMILIEKVWLTHDAVGECLTYAWCW
jgi:hypothetical protein